MGSGSGREKAGVEKQSQKSNRGKASWRTIVGERSIEEPWWKSGPSGRVSEFVWSWALTPAGPKRAFCSFALSRP